MAARMSSAVSCEYAPRSSCTLTPSARLSRMSETQMRVPRMHGLAKQTLGSIEIRLKRSWPLTSGGLLSRASRTVDEVRPLRHLRLEGTRQSPPAPARRGARAHERRDGVPSHLRGSVT